MNYYIEYLRKDCDSWQMLRGITAISFERFEDAIEELENIMQDDFILKGRICSVYTGRIVYEMVR